MGDDDKADHDARTIFVANLMPSKVTEELLYELFLQGGPIERVSIPKDKDGNDRGFGFVTYRHQVSVPYALKVFAGTRLFNRELRIDNRGGTGTGPNSNGGQNRSQTDQLRNPRQHQYQMQHQNPFGNTSSALTNPMSNFSGNPLNMMPTPMNVNQINFPTNTTTDYQQLLALSAQLFASANGMGNANNEMHDSQSKMNRRNDRRPHNQNSNSQYSRDDRERDRRDRARERSPRPDWIRNRRDDRRDNNRDRNSRGNDRRRNDNRR